MAEQPVSRFKSGLDAAARLSPWFYMAVLFGGLAAIVVLSVVFPATFYDGLVYPYLWRPVLFDEGFNPVNTAVLVGLSVLAIGWYQSLFRTYGQRIDVLVFVVGLLYLAIGSGLRVFEDSDLFAPYAEDLARAGLPPDTSCAPGLGGGFLQECVGAFFVTPLIWIWIGILLFLIARLAYEAELIELGSSARQGFRFYAASAAALWTLHLVGWHLDPAFVRYVPHPAWTAAGFVAGVGLVAWRQRRDGRLNWRWGMIGYGLGGLVLVAHYMATWFLGGVGAWSPGATRGWVLVGFLVAPTLVVVGLWYKGKALTRRERTASPTGTFWALVYVVLLEAAFAFGLLVGLDRLARGGSAMDGVVLVGAAPLAVLGGTVLLRSAPRLVPHADFAVFRDPCNLVFIWAHLADALMTGLGLDVLGAQEKHVVPRSLIAWFDALALPGVLGDYPAAVVMILYKVTIALALVWVLDRKVAPILPHWPNLNLHIKLFLMSVGYAPAARDAIRSAMGV